MKRVAILLNSSWNIVNFRRNIVKAIQAQGMQVVAITPEDDYTELVKDIGCEHITVQFQSASLNPFIELKTLIAIHRAVKAAKVDVLLSFTAKPNIYGSLAARGLGVPIINNVAGLGSGFVGRSPLSVLLRFLYKLAFSGSSTVFFQNNDDLGEFLQRRIVSTSQVSRLPGSGVDLDKFPERPLPERPPPPFRFLMVARMLRSKGVLELVEAARALGEDHLRPFEVVFIGGSDVDNNDSLSAEQMNDFAKSNYIRYLGHVDDIALYLESSHCVVLPSYYREGVPRSLLEALATGRPIITTDMPGCRETVNADNGFLVSPRSAAALEEAMAKMLAKETSELYHMGRASRLLAEEKYDSNVVSQEYLAAISRAIPK